MDGQEDWVEAELARLRMRLFGWSPARREAGLLRLAAALVQEVAYDGAEAGPAERTLALMRHSAGLGLLAEVAGRPGEGAALPTRPGNGPQASDALGKD